MLKHLQDHIRAMRAFADQGDLPVWRQALEILAIWLVRGIGPGYYLIGRFSRPDISFAEKLNYFNGRQYQRRVFELNDPRYHKASQHKVIEAAVLRMFSLPAPDPLGFFQREVGQTLAGGALRNADQLRHYLERSDIDRFVAKPCEGYAGRGFKSAKWLGDGKLQLFNDETLITVEEFVEEHLVDPAGYLLQSYVVQHPEVAELNPSSVNTARIMVYRPQNGEPVCIGAVIRIGRENSVTDNVSAGGLTCPVDLESGEVQAGRGLDASQGVYEFHPNSGARIKGRILPFWQEAKALSCRALICFPNFRFVGLDVAFTKDGPILIELNVNPDYVDFAVQNVPSRRVLSDSSAPVAVLQGRPVGASALSS